MAPVYQLEVPGKATPVPNQAATASSSRGDVYAGHGGAALMQAAAAHRAQQSAMANAFHPHTLPVAYATPDPASFPSAPGSGLVSAAASRLGGRRNGFPRGPARVTSIEGR
jgi:hypothetical protein